MRPAEFSPEDIIAAGEALQAAGRNVTGFALRQRVGGGNPNRLKQVWDEHVASKSAAEAVPVAELPVEVAEEVAAVTRALTERIAQLATELNDKAVKAAERRVSEVVRAAGEQRAQAERELADAAQTVEDMEAVLDQNRATIQTLEQRLAESQHHGQTQALELAQLRERIAAMEKSAQAAAEAHARELADATAVAGKLRADLDEARDGLAVARATVEQSERRVEDLRTELNRAHAEVDEVRGALAAAEQEHKEQRKQAAAEALRVAERLTAIQAERDEARKEAAQAREETARLAGRVDVLAEQNAALLEGAPEKPVRGKK